MGTQSCKTCRHLSAPLDADGKVRVRWAQFYSCRAWGAGKQAFTDEAKKRLDGDLLGIPESVRIIVQLSRVKPGDGAKCSAWQPREKAIAVPHEDIK